MCSHNLLHINNPHTQSEISSFNIVILCACIWNMPFTSFSNSEHYNFNLVVHKFNFLSKIIWCRQWKAFFDSEPYESDKIIYEHDLWYMVYICYTFLLLFSPKVAFDSCKPMDCSLSGFSVHGISKTILEWVAISFSRDLPNPGIKPASAALVGRFFTT